MTTGAELTTFVTNLNGGASIDPTLLSVLVQTAQAIIEEERPWMVLRKTDTSLSLTTAGTWQTAKSLSGLTDFSRFYSEYPVVLFDSSTNRRHYYRLVPFDRRLEFKDISDTFVFDENAGTLYFNGIPPFSGTLYTHYLSTSAAIDPAATTAVWSLFPSRFLPLVGYYAIGVYKGAIDYDSINRQMLPSNQTVMLALKNAMEKWDNERQLSTLDHNDPSEPFGGYPRSGAIDTDS